MDNNPTQFPRIKCIPIFFIRLCRLWGKLENHVRNSKYYIPRHWDQLVSQPSIPVEIEFKFGLFLFEQQIKSLREDDKAFSSN